PPVVSALSKRSVDEPMGPYAGVHSIMRFGRAPHNIMHFGKRGWRDSAASDEASTNSNESPHQLLDTSPGNQQQQQQPATGSGVRFVFVPVVVHPRHYRPQEVWPAEHSPSEAALRESLRQSLRQGPLAMAKKDARSLTEEQSGDNMFLHFG